MIKSHFQKRMEMIIKDSILCNIDFSEFNTCVDCVKVILLLELEESELVEVNML